MKAVIKILFISRYEIILYLERSTHRIKTRGTSMEDTMAAESVCNSINSYYTDIYAGLTLAAYLISFINLCGTLMRLNFNIISTLWFLMLIPYTVYLFFFLFTDHNIKIWNARIEEHIKEKGYTVLRTIIWIYILCAIPVFCLSLHILSVFGNPAG